MSNLFRTPFFNWHLDAGARMGPFAGWDMPIQYKGILDEHEHTRSVASAFDTSHMGEFDLSGPTAAADLDRLLTQHVHKLKLGQCNYGFLCNEQGGVIDDLTCYRRAEDHFTLIVNAGTLAGDASHIQRHISATTTFEDLSPQRAKFDIQGPRSKELIEKALHASLPDLKYFRFVDCELAGIPLTLSRTGYTGEWGYEFYLAADRALELWQGLMAPGDILPAGLGARDTLRLEMAYPLYGSELNAETSPVAATGGKFIAMDKDFIGKAAMDADPVRRLVGLQLESKRAARAHDRIFVGDREVGDITSGSLAPSLGVAVAFAYVDKDAGPDLEIDVRGKRLSARQIDLPFYKEGSARRKLA